MTDAPNPAAPAPLPHAAIMAIMTGILLAMFLSALEQTIVAPALPTIGRTLGDVENLSWTVTAYLLANTAVTPLFGKLSDIHGRRRMMLTAIVIFIVGSIACALAPNMPALIAGRALQGIGGGGILPHRAHHHRRHGLAARAAALPELHLDDVPRRRASPARCWAAC